MNLLFCILVILSFGKSYSNSIYNPKLEKKYIYIYMTFALTIIDPSLLKTSWTFELNLAFVCDTLILGDIFSLIKKILLRAYSGQGVYIY